MTFEPKKLIPEQLDQFNKIFGTKCPLHSFDIDCSKILSPEKFDFNERKTGILGNLFTLLDKISSPCLYWFECENSREAVLAENDLNIFREQNSGRNIPVRNNNKDSNILYVGIRQGGKRKDGFTNIAGRIYIHLGYYKVGSTQGLQLSYWAKSRIKLSVIELPEDAKPYLNIMEKFYAISLKPVVGKH